MKYLLVLVLALMMAVPTIVVAGDDKKTSEKSDDMEKLTNATTVIQEFAGMKEGPPRDLVEKAQAVLVVPSLVKASLVVGGEHGDGVLTVRDANGNWGQPVFVDLTGGSFGFQAGVSSTDLVLILMHERDINEILDGEFTLGAEAGVAAGPIGRQGSAGTDVHFEDAIYSYSRSKGVFAGVSVEGSKLSLDKSSNETLYPGQTNMREVVKKAPAAGTPGAALASALKDLTGEKTAAGAAGSSGQR